MISRDAGAALLQPLAEPTMSAFAAARKHSQTYQKATAEGRAYCSAPALGLMDGVSFWGFFSSLLVEGYAGVPSVVKIEDAHPLMHVWIVNEALCLQLKSDISGLDAEQLMIPGIEEVAQSAPDLIALTWHHAGVERFGPTFVHLTPYGQAWRLPVAPLVYSPVETVDAVPPKPQLSSRTKPAKDSRDADSDSR